MHATSLYKNGWCKVWLPGLGADSPDHVQPWLAAVVARAGVGDGMHREAHIALFHQALGGLGEYRTTALIWLWLLIEKVITDSNRDHWRYARPARTRLYREACSKALHITHTNLQQHAAVIHDAYTATHRSSPVF